jgi:hypothetical protein
VWGRERGEQGKWRELKSKGGEGRKMKEAGEMCLEDQEEVNPRIGEGERDL